MNSTRAATIISCMEFAVVLSDPPNASPGTSTTVATRCPGFPGRGGTHTVTTRAPTCTHTHSARQQVLALWDHPIAIVSIQQTAVRGEAVNKSKL